MDVSTEIKMTLKFRLQSILRSITEKYLKKINLSIVKLLMNVTIFFIMIQRQYRNIEAIYTSLIKILKCGFNESDVTVRFTKDLHRLKLRENMRLER